MDRHPVTPKPAPTQALLTEKQVAARLNVAASTLKAWRTTGRVAGPPHCKLGGAVRFRASDLQAWINSNVRHSKGAT